jgi:hypothetical protein
MIYSEILEIKTRNVEGKMMRKSSKKAALAVAAMLVGSMFCTPVFAAAPDTNEATYGDVDLKSWGDNNDVASVGAQVFDSLDYNIATSFSVRAINGSATNPENYNDVMAIGARVGESRDWNIATMKGDVTAKNFGSGISGLRNEVTAIGAQILDSKNGNTATQGANVTASNSGDFSNVTAIGVSIADSGHNNTATTGSWGAVTATNIPNGADLVNPTNGVHDAGLNNVLAFGAGISESGDGNTAHMQTYVSAINYANYGNTYGNDVTAIGALVSGSDNGNTAKAWSTFAEIWPDRNDQIDGYHGESYNNTATSLGAQVIDSGSYNTANAMNVRLDMGGFGNSVAAVGAQVLNSGNYNVATGGDVYAKSVGNNNKITAIGAQISKSVKKK